MIIKPLNVKAIVLLCCLAALSACQQEQPALPMLEQIKHDGVLTVVTRNTPTTYYEDRDGQTGFEFELAQRYAQSLGVRLQMYSSNNIDQAYQDLASKQSHIAAAGITSSADRDSVVSFGYPYLEVSPILVYRAHTSAPRDLSDLNGTLMVMQGSSHVQRLKELKALNPGLAWQETADLEVTDLFKMIEEGEIAYALVNSNEYDVNREFFPMITKAFSVGAKQQLSWAFKLSDDNSLLVSTQQFFQKLERDGTLVQLKERYYGHVSQFNYVGARSFIRHIEDKLPAYKETFMQAAAEQGLDWRLLAATAYQESRWNPAAVSATGVRGLMMLTLTTAKEVGISNRLDPEQSIAGGAIYLSKIQKRLPADIQNPDHTWFALASYNVGYGHVADARAITQMQGGDPNKWMDVKQRLPLLQKKKWYKNTKHGYARGQEPVNYVQNIRRYYDTLLWVTQKSDLQLVDRGVDNQHGDKN